MVKNIEIVPTGIEKILEQQDIVPYLKNTGVDEVFRNHPDEVTHKTAVLLFMLGYIDGKRAERARRAVRHDGV